MPNFDLGTGALEGEILRNLREGLSLAQKGTQ